MSQSVANIKMWTARAMFRDLSEYHGGDANRFGRMVGAGGAPTHGCDPDDFAASIGRLSGALSGWFPVEISEMMAQLVTWGYAHGENGENVDQN